MRTLLATLSAFIFVTTLIPSASYSESKLKKRIDNIGKSGGGIMKPAAPVFDDFGRPGSEENSSSFTEDDHWTNIAEAAKLGRINSGLVRPTTGEPNLSINIPHFVGSDAGLSFPFRINYIDHRNGSFDIGESYETTFDFSYDPIGAGWQVDLPILRRHESISNEWQVYIPGRVYSKLVAPASLSPGQQIQTGVWYDKTTWPGGTGLYELGLDLEPAGLTKIEYAYDTIGGPVKFKFTFPDGIKYIFESSTGHVSSNTWFLDKIYDRSETHYIDMTYPPYDDYYAAGLFDDSGNSLILYETPDYGDGKVIYVDIKRHNQNIVGYEGTAPDFDLLWPDDTTGTYRFLTKFERASVGSPGSPSKTETLYEFEYHTTQDKSEDTGVLTAYTNKHGGRVSYTYNKYQTTSWMQKDYYSVSSATKDDALGNQHTYNYLNWNGNASSYTNAFRDGSETNAFGTLKVPHYILKFEEQRPDTSWLIIDHETTNFRNYLNNKVKQVTWAGDNFGTPGSPTRIVKYNRIYFDRHDVPDATDPTIVFITDKIIEDYRSTDGSVKTLRTDYLANTIGQVGEIHQINDPNLGSDDKTISIKYAWETYPEALSQNFTSAVDTASMYFGIGTAGLKLAEKRQTWENSTGIIFPDTHELWVGDRDNDNVDDYIVTDVSFSVEGQLLTETSPSGLVKTYEYSGPNLLIPTKVTAQGTTGSNYTKTSTFTAEGFLNTKTGLHDSSRPDRLGLTSTYTYDEFWRLKTIHYSDDSNTYSIEKEFHTDTVPEWTKVTWHNETGRPGSVSTNFFDGFGRKIQNRKYDSVSGKDLVTTIEYNNTGKIFRNYLSLVAAHQDAYVATDISSDQYFEYGYTTDGLSVRNFTLAPDVDSDGSHEEYGSYHYADHMIEYQRDSDRNNPFGAFYRRIDYSSIGQAISVTEDYLGPEAATTTYEYTPRGYMNRMTDPDGRVTEFRKTAEGEYYSNFPDMTGTQIDNAGNATNYSFNNPNLKDQFNLTWDQKTVSDDLLRPSQTFIANTSQVTQTSLNYQYDDFDRPFSTSSVSTEITQKIAESANYQRDVAIEIRYDDYTFEAPNPDGINSDTPQNLDALSRNLWFNGVPATNGKVTKLWSPGVTILNSYDMRGRLTAVDYAIDKNQDGIINQCTGGQTDECYVVKYAYDNLDRLIAIRYPNNHLVEYSYDGFGRILSLTYTDSSGIPFTLADMTYADNSTGRPYLESTQIHDNSILNPPALNINFTHNDAGKLTHIDADYAANPIYEHDLTYDVRGNPASYSSGITQLSDFSYDRLSRLSSTTHTVPMYGEDSDYLFDGFGNRSSVTTPTESTIYSYLDRTGDQYSYGAFTNLVEQAGNHYYYHDERGRRIGYKEIGQPPYYDPAGDAKDTYFYDDFNRLIAFGFFTPQRGQTPPTFQEKESYVYGPDSKRYLKYSPTENILYLYHGNEVIYTQDIDSGDQTTYTFAGSRRISRNDNAGFHFYVQDHLGTTKMMTRLGVVESQEIRNSYGNFLSGSQYAERFVFTGREEDKETGLIYMNARYYDPVIGRFITPDPYLGKVGKPFSSNRFSYVLNNPLRYVDPTGFFEDDYGYDGGDQDDNGYEPDYEGDDGRIYHMEEVLVTADRLSFERDMDWQFEDAYEDAHQRDKERDRQRDSILTAGAIITPASIGKTLAELSGTNLAKLGQVGLAIFGVVLVVNIVDGAANQETVLNDFLELMAAEQLVSEKLNAGIEHFTTLDGARTIGAMMSYLGQDIAHNEQEVEHSLVPGIPYNPAYGY